MEETEAEVMVPAFIDAVTSGNGGFADGGFDRGRRWIARRASPWPTVRKRKRRRTLSSTSLIVPSTEVSPKHVVSSQDLRRPTTETVNAATVEIGTSEVPKRSPERTLTAEDLNCVFSELFGPNILKNVNSSSNCEVA